MRNLEGSPFVDLRVDASRVLAGRIGSRVLVSLDVVHLQRCGQQVLYAVEDASKDLDRNRVQQVKQTTSRSSSEQLRAWASAPDTHSHRAKRLGQAAWSLQESR